MGQIIGIDLGTTNSVMAVMEGLEPKVLVNAEGGHTTPSVVAWSGGERLVGKVALNQQTMNVDNTIHSVKRIIGRRYDEIPAGDLDQLMYHVVRSPDGRPSIALDERVAGRKSVSPELVSAAIVSKLKADAEAFLGEEVTDAVVTVPAYFGDAQRQATQAACRIAGLNVRRIINEPTAAALAYGIDRLRSARPNDRSERLILVFDLGGGTLDVSLLVMSGGLLRVISTAGDNHLGGDDIDEMIAEMLCDEFEAQHGIDLHEDPTSYARVREAAKQAKEELSSTMQTTISLPFISAIGTNPLHIMRVMMRSEMERLISDFVERCKGPIHDAVASCRIDIDMRDVTDVLLVGGSTRIPAIQRMVAAECGVEPQRTVNPDEIVAMGAAVQAAMLTDEDDTITHNKVVLADVNSVSLGVRLADKTVDVLIPRNTVLPASQTVRGYTNARDGQTSINIVIIQGEDKDDAYSPRNSVLGRATISGFAPMPAETADITVTMTCDVNGMIEVTGRDENTGKSVRTRINATTRLAETAINDMANEERAARWRGRR